MILADCTMLSVTGGSLKTVRASVHMHVTSISQGFKEVYRYAVFIHHTHA